MTEVVSIVSQVGFPIAACVALYVMITKTMQKNTDAINNNTNIMTKLVDKLEQEK